MLKTILFNEREIINTIREETDNKALKSVQNILKDVKKNKDKALRKYTSLFDQVDIENFRVSNAEILEAYSKIDEDLKNDLKIAYNNIKLFHEKQLTKGYTFEVEKENYLGQMVTPISRVGIYVPGGTATYPSTVLMNAIPAIVAGVKEIVMITPPDKDGKVSDIILTAAKIAGITEIYKVGGAQGIGALAYGTETIQPVSKIVGPGNIYVALAKKEVFGTVGIDMIAGPSEILIYADKDSNPKFIAADLLSQAEHDELAKVILVTKSKELIKNVKTELSRQLELLSRNEIATKAIKNNGFAVLINSETQAIQVINEVAPEHLELLAKSADKIIPKITNAGAIFVGEFSPEPLGDYIAGPNHTLPTSGTAKFASPLSVDDFTKKTSYIRFTKEGLKAYKDSIIRIANKEGLTAHANAIKVRFYD